MPKLSAINNKKVSENSAIYHNLRATLSNQLRKTSNFLNRAGAADGESSSADVGAVDWWIF